MVDIIKEEVMENKSKIYYNGSIWKNNKNENFKIIGKYKQYGYYKIKFSDGTEVKATTCEISSGSIQNLNSLKNNLSICGVGYLGERFLLKKHKKEYGAWVTIIKRCYNKNDKNYHNYGGIGVTLEESLHSFSNFIKVISILPNYDKWKKDTENKWHLDKDIVCEELNISPKIYSKNTIKFITRKENLSERNKRFSITGLTYTAYREVDNYIEEFQNQREFCRKHGLDRNQIRRCIKGEIETYKGWEIKINKDI